MLISHFKAKLNAAATCRAHKTRCVPLNSQTFSKPAGKLTEDTSEPPADSSRRILFSAAVSASVTVTLDEDDENPRSTEQETKESEAKEAHDRRRQSDGGSAKMTIAQARLEAGEDVELRAQFQSMGMN